MTAGMGYGGAGAKTRVKKATTLQQLRKLGMGLSGPLTVHGFSPEDFPGLDNMLCCQTDVFQTVINFVKNLLPLHRSVESCHWGDQIIPLLFLLLKQKHIVKLMRINYYLYLL